MDAGDVFFIFGVVVASMAILLLVLLCVVFMGDSESNYDDAFIPNQFQIDESTFANLKSPRIRVWLENNKPKVIHREINPMEITPELILIRDRGIQSFNFREWVPDLTVDERTPLLDQTQAPYFINDNLEIEFNNSNIESNSMLNLPIPIQNRRNDTSYFEVKLLEITEGVTIGLVTSPYPNWCLPGVLPYSLGINSMGQLITNGNPNDPLQLLPKLNRGDIIGIGIRFNSGSIFISHNGRNVMEIIRGVKFDLYPCIGAQGRCKVSVNIGQIGYLLIEANVKKWGFCENQNEGQLGAPPVYGKQSSDVVLDKGDDLPPKYPEQGFFD